MILKLCAALGLFIFLALARQALSGPADETPIGPKWWPSPWGADDQRGAANRLTRQKVLQANRLIRTGEVYSLGRPYEYGMPLPGKRHFSLVIPGSPTGGPDGENRVVYHDELFSGEIGQIGTQLDGLGHIGVRIGDDDFFYNGFKRSQFGKAYGLEKLGIENVGVFFTRGILVDLPSSRHVPRMKVGEVITVADIEGALKAEGVRVTEGDALFFRTGHGQLWMKDNATFASGEPGPGMAAARWLSDRKIALVGSDTWATEVVPAENPNRPFEVHQHLLVRNGIYNLENLDLEALARDRVYEFAFIFAPLRLRGATGSPGNPIAVR
jgi:kynurenine formamidase